MEAIQTNGDRSLSERLAEPDTAAALNRLLDRLDVIEKTLDTAAVAARQGPGMASMFADVADDFALRAQDRGIDIDERLSAALALAEKLTAPRTMAVLSGLLDRIDQIEKVVELADKLPGMVAMFADVADDIVLKAEDNGIDVDARLRSALAFGDKLTAPEAVEAFNGVLDPGAVAIVGMAGRTLIKCKEECLAHHEPPRLSPFGLLRKMRDPDVQRSLSFLANFGRFFGQGMVQIHARYTAEKEAALTNGQNNGKRIGGPNAGSLSSGDRGGWSGGTDRGGASAESSGSAAGCAG